MSKARSNTMRLATGVMGALYVILMVPALRLCLRLHGTAEVFRSRVVVWACLLLMAAPLLAWLSFYMRKYRKSLLIGAGALAAGSLVVAIWCVTKTPDGQRMAGSGVGSVFTGETRYARCSPANLVPEIDQLKLGSYLFPRLDPFIDHAQGRRLRNLFLDVYRDMRKSEEFVCLGSVMNQAYREMFLDERGSGHFYEYIPKSDPEGPLPVILFLHGSLGNFKGYLWVWKALADEKGVAIVAPTFGAGNWDRDGGVEAVAAAVTYCENHPRLDAGHITLAGLSNGGKGVSRAALQNPDAFHQLIYISPIMETGILSQDAFIEAWRGRRALILHGTEDHRIPMKRVETGSVLLEDNGMRVEAVYYEEEDHFLFFSQRDHVIEDISNWLDLEESSQ